MEQELTGKETEPWEIVYFKPYKRSRGYCLEMICADFPAGANLDNSDPDALLQALSRSLRFLPTEQRPIFLQYASTAP